MIKEETPFLIGEWQFKRIQLTKRWHLHFEIIIADLVLNRRRRLTIEFNQRKAMSAWDLLSSLSAQNCC